MALAVVMVSIDVDNTTFVVPTTIFAAVICVPLSDNAILGEVDVATVTIPLVAAK